MDDTGFAASGTLYAPTGLKVSVAKVQTLCIGACQAGSNQTDIFSSGDMVSGSFVWSNKLSAASDNGKEYLLTAE